MRKKTSDGDCDGFLAALSKEGEKYLGRVPLVREIMMNYVDERMADQGKGNVSEILKRYAEIFLGESKEYRPVPSWNEPGGIDKFIEKQLNIRAETPTTAVMFLLVKMYDDVVSISQSGKSYAERQSEFLGQMEMWLKILMGIDPNEQGINLIPNT